MVLMSTGPTLQEIMEDVTIVVPFCDLYAGDVLSNWRSVLEVVRSHGSTRVTLDDGTVSTFLDEECPDIGLFDNSPVIRPYFTGEVYPGLTPQDVSPYELWSRIQQAREEQR